MNASSVDTLYEVVWKYVDMWRNDCSGPWWEGDLSLDVGCLLAKELAGQASANVARLPGFLSHWPQNTWFRRLGSENHFSVAGPGGIRPDYAYRRPGKDSCEWVLELKLGLLTGAAALKGEAGACVQSLEGDANKYSGWAEPPYLFLFLAVNIPAKFVGRRRNHYPPEEFVEELVRELKASRRLGELAGGGKGGLCVVVKTIDADADPPKAGLSLCLATRDFGQSNCRPPDIDYCEFP